MKLQIHLKSLGIVLVKAFKRLVKNDPLRLAGATAFFTTFALPPILLLLIQLLSLIFNSQSISTRMFSQLTKVVGEGSVHEVLEILKGFRGLASNAGIAIAGIFFLLFVATTLFKVIQSSINQVWRIQRSGTRRFRMAMIGRLKSALVIIFSGLLFLASLAAESLKLVFGNYLDELFPVAGFYLNGTISSLISVIIVCTWFTILFRYLPDGRPTWRVAFFGGLLTSLLYNVGMMILKFLLLNSNIGVVYGASASIVFLLLFLFYSSLIFYYGASFTKECGDHLGYPIQPVSNAELYE